MGCNIGFSKLEDLTRPILILNLNPISDQKILFMKKKTKKKLDVKKVKIARLSESNQAKLKAATIPPNTFWCEGIGL